MEVIKAEAALGTTCLHLTPVFLATHFLDDDGDDGYGPGGGNGNGGSSGGSSGGGIIYNSYHLGAVNFSKHVSLWGGPERYGFVVPEFNGNYVISGKRISVYVEGTNSFPDVKYSAAVEIYNNGQLYYSQSLNRDSLPPEIVYTSGHQPIGTCTTDLPITGKVKIKVIMGASYSGSTGNYASNTSYTNILAE